MKLKQITGLARRLDPRYPAHLAMMVVATAVAILGFIGQLVAGRSLGEAISWSIVAAFLTGFTWVIGRELDPDYELSAFVGVALFLISLLFYDVYAVWPALLVVMALRIVNRSTGLMATWLDSAAFTIIASWLVGSTGHWEYGAVAVLALLLDAFSPAPSRRQLLFAPIGLLVTLFWMWAIVSDRVVSSLSMWEWMVAGITAVLFITLIILRSNHIHSQGDATKQPLRPRRVQAAQLLAVIAGLLFLWQGADKLLALWSAMLGVSLYRIPIILRGKK